METKKVKLESGVEVKIQQLSVDDIDYCNDVPEMAFSADNETAPTVIRYLSKARTAWLRKGIADCDDGMIKALTDTDKAELMTEIQEFQRLGEGKPSS